MINCCVCYAEPKWNDVGHLKIEMTKNDTCSALFRNPLNLYTYYYANYHHGDLTEIPCNTALLLRISVSNIKRQLTSSMFEILLNEKSIVIIFVKLHVLHGISVRSP
jgi:hypothetical protein